MGGTPQPTHQSLAQAERDAHICDLYRAGVDQVIIAKEVGLSPSRICRVLALGPPPLCGWGHAREDQPRRTDRAIQNLVRRTAKTKLESSRVPKQVYPLL
jgi:hypothetical protein